MSKPRPHMKCDLQSVYELVQMYASMPFVERVMITGSRSPLRKKIPREDSDWDLILVTSIDNVKYPQPREGYNINADLLVKGPAYPEDVIKSVEIWPTDKHGVFIDVKNS